MTFLKSKIYTFIFLLLLYVPILFFVPSDTMVENTVLTYSYMLIGCGHFFLGFLYQYRSQKRRSKIKKIFLVMWFPLLTLAGLTLLLLFFDRGAIAPYTAIAGLLFLVHGALNEQTLLEKSGLSRMPFGWYLLIPVFFLAYLFSFLDPYIFLTPEGSPIQVYTGNEWWFIVMFFTSLFAYFILGIIAILDAIKNNNLLSCIGWTVLSGFLLAVVFVTKPLSFNWILAVLLVYHFVNWQIYYFIDFWKKDRKVFIIYLKETVAVYIFFVFVFIVLGYSIKIFFFLVTAYHFFNILHILTSLYNETPVKKFFGV